MTNKPSNASVVVESALFEDGKPAFALKISGPGYELNVWASREELKQLGDVSTACWEDRRSIKLGRCAESPVFWCAESERVTIMVGQDDEVWDFAVTVPLTFLADLKRALAAEGF